MKRHVIKTLSEEAKDDILANKASDLNGIAR